MFTYKSLLTHPQGIYRDDLTPDVHHHGFDTMHNKVESWCDDIYIGHWNQDNVTVMVLIPILPAVRTLVIGLLVICRVNAIILHLPVLFIMAISAIIILTNTVDLRLTKAKFTPANVRMISAMDWVN